MVAAVRVFCGSGKVVGHAWCWILRMPTIGRVVLWTKFGLVVRCCLQMGRWSKGWGIKTDIGKHTLEHYEAVMVGGRVVGMGASLGAGDGR